MGVIVGFVIGYVLGTRAGEEGWEELMVSWKAISTSDEVKDLVTGGLGVARDFARQGANLLAERLSQPPGETGLRAA